MCISAALAILCATAPTLQREVLKVSYTMPRPMFARLIQVRAQAKGEYETTSAFEKRLQAQTDRLFGSGRLFLVAETSSRYNADSGKLSLLTATNLPSEGDTLADPTAVVVAMSFEDKGTYVVQNELGAESAVAHNVFHLFKVLFDNSKASFSGLYDGDANAFKVQLPMRATEAKERASTVRLLLECTVKKPVQFLYSEGTARRPDFEYPYEMSTIEYSIPATLRKIVVFDSATREVLLVRRIETK